MAKKIKAGENQPTLLDVSEHEPHSIESKEAHDAEKRAYADDHPLLMEWRERFISEHIARYPDGLCAYFRYEFRQDS